LRSHKSDSTLCSHTLSDSVAQDLTSILSHSSDLKPHAISTSSSDSYNSNVNLSPRVTLSLPNDSTASSKSTNTPTQHLPDSATIQPATSFIPPSYNQALIDNLIKLLSYSPAKITSSIYQTPAVNHPILPSLPLLNAVPAPDLIPKLSTTLLSNLCSASTDSSSSSTGLPILQYGSVKRVPGQKLPIPTLTSSLFPTTGVNPDPMNLFNTFSSIYPTHTGLSGSKLSNMPTYPHFTHTFDKNILPPILKPHTILHPCILIPGSSPSVSNVMPCSSSLSTTLTTPEPISTHPTGVSPMSTSEDSSTSTTRLPTSTSEKIPTPAFNGVLTHAPDEFPASNLGLLETPSQTYHHSPSLSSGYNQTVLNALHKLLLSMQTPNAIPASSQSSVFKSKLNETSSPNPIIKSPSVSTPCKSSISRNDCLPIGPFLPHKLPLPLPIPNLPQSHTSSIHSSYNPEFLKQLIKHLFFNSASLPPPLSSEFSITRPTLITSTMSPPILSSTSSPTTNEKFPEYQSNSMKGLSNELPSESLAIPPINSNNSRFDNNTVLANLLYKILLSSSNDSKSPLNSCLPPSSLPLVPKLSGTQESVLVPNSLVNCKTLNNVLNKFPSISSSGSILPFSDTIPSSITPSSVIKTFPEPFKNIIPATVPVPNLTPLPCLLGLNSCHLKHSRPHKSHFQSPCSLSPTKLSIGCKHL